MILALFNVLTFFAALGAFVCLALHQSSDPLVHSLCCLCVCEVSGLCLSAADQAWGAVNAVTAGWASDTWMCIVMTTQWQEKRDLDPVIAGCVPNWL